MNKVSFITIHVGSNFGSVLQAIATSVTLKSIGCEPTIVNYIPPRVSNKRFWNTGNANPIKKLMRFLWKLYMTPQRIIDKKVYLGYLKQYCSLSQPIYAEDSFAEKCPKADVYLTGSDQVWNLKHNEGLDAHYFFDGIEGKKVSFASSIGYTDIGDEARKAFKRYLSEYISLSVREDSAVEFLASLGLKAIQLLDPVFLLNKDEWKQYVPKIRIVKERYLLIYAPYNTVDKSVIYKHALLIAQKENLKIVTFSWTYYKDMDADKTIRFASPGDFLDLMMNAEYVITNSFHGTAFSIDLNKKFWVFLPSGFTTRITSVLSKFALTDRLVDETKDAEWDYGKEIDYDMVNSILLQERKKSIDYLKEAVL